MNGKLASVFICIFAISIEHTKSAPYQETSRNINNIEDCVECYGPSKTQEKHAPPSKRINHRDNKKDIFISRGWGAGGMPFSVLYMNPTFSSPKAAGAVTEKQHKVTNTNHRVSNSHRIKSSPQLRTSYPSKTRGSYRKPHSVIPQLFVSYGWGPLGRK